MYWKHWDPYGAPRPTESENPPATKKKFQKTQKPRLSPKVNARSPKVNARSPKVNARSLKVNVKYFQGILEEFKVFEIGRPRFGSVRLRFGDVAVQAVPVFGSGGSSTKMFFFSVFQYSLTGKNGSGSGFGSWKTVPAVPVPLSVSGKTVPTVPVSGSGGGFGS